jgi:hypothetical protein
MLPDFGSFYVQTIGTKPVHLSIPEGSVTGILTADNKLFGINFVADFYGQRMMGTVEFFGAKADAMKVAKELVGTGVYCQVRPDLAYTGVDGWQHVVPFRLYKDPEPLSQEAQDRVQAAEAKRARKAAKRLPKK